MNKIELIKTSFRIIRRNKLRTFFMMLGIVISITALMLTLGLGKGFKRQISERVQKYLGSNNIIVMAQKVNLKGKPLENGLVSTLTIDDINAIGNQLPFFTMYDPVQFSQREIIAGNKSVTTQVRGSSEKGEFAWNRNVTRGQYFNEAEVIGSSRIALLGPRIATELFGNSDPVNKQLRIGGVPFTVKGVLAPKGVDPHGNDLDRDVIIPITTLMNRVDNVDYIALGKFVLKDEGQMDQAVKAIREMLMDRHQIMDDNNADFMIITPSFVKDKINEMTKVFNVLLPVISLIALLAAAFVIMIVMVMSVNERVFEIGLRKATGARSGDVLNQFILESSMVSFIGGIIGIMLGTALLALVKMHMGISSGLSFGSILIILLLPLIVGIISGIIPARKAAKYHPAKALK